MGVVFYGIARLMCANDPRAFRYLALQLNTKAMHRDRAYWKSGTYSPMPCRRRH
jgi:type IV secretory pathway VirB3-like protein